MSKSLNRLFHHLETLIREGDAAINAKLDRIIHHQHEEIRILHMERDEITRLTASVRENTDATKATTVVLTELVTANEKLAADLKAAIEAGGSDVSQEIKDAADAIDANNVAMRAAIPQLATAVTENTAAESAAGKGTAETAARAKGR